MTIPDRERTLKTTAIVVSYNSARDLPMSLGSLRELPIADIVVVDNSSSDDSVQVAARYTPHIIRSANVGFGKAINAAAAEFPDADAYLLLNPDAALEPDSYAELSRALTGDAKIGVVAPQMRYADGEPGISAGPDVSLLKEWLAALRVDHLVPGRVKRALAGSRLLRSRIPMLDYLDQGGPAAAADVAWVSGFCMLVRADAFRDVNGFDPSFFLYFEDVDFCKRLRGAGWRVVSVGTAWAAHRESTSTGAVGKNRLYRSGLVSYTDKYGTAVDRFLARALRRLPL
ncbi:MULTISPECIES: glycosyltransferase family 2 protein [Micromonospora]|uniref:Glycosyltransferase family 2 protein n=1 Tax=Micromonospora solifontis TaxID=2487138 RepID=A0ABX9WGH9_9ACTN|nr:MULTISPECIES: glycosyltransferase family 2 protein [Micromonospora]NES15122.1 glycosyltransferase family 2 protein [Micromonospora sp. PPF5-17B]NES36871.1 glycosyltransferase family 2 protein [Micromonospora solifontis]NES56457.1 glycosyltransferase family 2 protein [Micromonospora sp. PPF5-6]RNL99059.1 glycosyltransferase family 2 protein [Micromonospora solifontis]